MKPTYLRAIGFALAGTAVLSGMWLTWKALRHTVPATPNPSESSTGVLSAQSAVGVSEADRLGREKIVQRPEGQSGRSPPKTMGIQGVVTLREGLPLARASVSWTSKQLLDSREASGLAADHDGLARYDASEETDDSGAFEFDRPLAGGEVAEGVVWASHPSGWACSRDLEPIAGSGYSRLEIELDRADPLWVEVLGPDGAPAPGAEVIQEGTGVPPLGTILDPLQAKRLKSFWRRYETDAHGRVQLHQLDAEQRVTARMGELHASPFVGKPKGRIRLRLGLTCSASGSVRCDGCEDSRSTMRVACLVIKNRQRTLLASTYVSPEATWSLEDLPVGEGNDLVFRLEGDGIVAVEQTLRGSSPGDRLQIDFQTQPGLKIEVLVVGPAELPLAGAEVQASWYVEPVWISSSGRTDVEGRADLTTCGAVSVFVGAKALGHAGARVGPITLPNPTLGIVRVALKPGGTISGTVRHDGRPIEDFEVVIWQGETETRKAYPITDSDDGSFVIDDAPLGHVSILASADLLPQCPVQIVPVESQRDTKVVLDLPAGIRGQGTVVDGVTGSPVPDACIQLTTSAGGQHLTERGQLVCVDSAGRFESSSFAPEQNLIWVRAPGYAPKAPSAFAAAEKDLDFGLITLWRTQTLEIRLVSSEPVDFTTFRVQSYRSGELPSRIPGADGVVRYEGIAPEFQPTVHLFYPDGTEQLIDIRVDAGRPWVYTIPVGGGSGLHVEIEDSPRRAEAKFAEIVSRDEQGMTSFRYARVAPDGTFEVRGLFGTSAMLSIVDSDWNHLKTLEVPLDPGRVRRIEVDLAPRAYRVRVVDGNHQPLPGSTVFASTLHNAEGWYRSYHTDDEGACEITGLDFDAVRLYAYHSAVGSSGPHIARLERGGAETILLEISGQSPIRLRLNDRGTPCPGVSVEIAHDGGLGVTDTISDAQGLTNSTPFGPGRYRAFVRQAGYWPHDQAFDHSPAGEEIPIELRRLGSVKVNFKNPQGLPIYGARIDLVNIEMGQSVSSWIEGGKLAQSSSGLTSNLQGQVYLEGLPNGDYSWQANFVDSTTLGGSCKVPAVGTGELAIVGP